MRKVRITSGVFGYKPEGGKYVVAVRAGDPPILVDDERAERLVNNGIAEYADAEGDAKSENDFAFEKTPERKTLEKMKLFELKRMAQDAGDAGAENKTKAELIRFILGEDGENGENVILSAEDVIR